MTTSKEYINNLAGHFSVAPASIHTVMQNIIDESYNSAYEITDASSPFVKLLVMTASNTGGAMEFTHRNARRSFASLAQNWSDLYPHIPPRLNVARMAQPAKNKEVSVVIPAESLRTYAVADSESGMDLIIIPKDTIFKVGDYNFNFYYPVNIYIAQDGSFLPVYDLDVTNPMANRVSNVIDNDIVYQNGVECLSMVLTCDEVLVTAKDGKISNLSPFKETYSFTHQFSYARVFHSTDTETWTELATTYDSEVFDISTPTALLSVGGSSITVRIPQIFTDDGSISGAIRTVIYSTHGAVEVNLGDYGSASWSMEVNNFQNLNPDYSGPFASVNINEIFSSAELSDGEDALTFDEVKSIILNGDESKDSPMTFEEVENTFTKAGMGIERQKDNLNGQVYLATRQLPTIDKDDLSNGAGVSCRYISFNTGDTDKLGHVVVNGDLRTIKTTALFLESDGEISLLSDQDNINLKARSNNTLVNLLNANSYFYSPLHYVIDDSTPITALRAYNLHDPYVESLTLKQSNGGLDFTVTVNDATVEYDDETQTFELSVNAATPGNGESVIAVLNYTHPTTGVKWEIQGETVTETSDATNYVFDITTLLDIDSDNEFTLEGLTNTDDAVLRVPLEDSKFDLVFGLVQASPTASTIDDHMAFADVDSSTWTSISLTTLTMVWGRYLESLYSVTRKTLTLPTYKTYQSDVVATYPANELESDANGVVLRIVDGKAQFNIVHAKGDIVYNDDGTPKVLHEAGSYVVDPTTGKYILDQSAGVAFEARLMLVDASYYFASTDAVVDYVESVPGHIETVLDDLMPPLNRALGKESVLYYEPVSNKARSKVSLSSGQETSLDTSLVFAFDIQLTKAAYENTATRDAIETGIRTVLTSYLQNRQFVTMALTKLLSNVSPSNIVNVSFDSPLGNYNSATLTENNAHWTIASKCLLLGNGNLDIVDDVSFNYSY